MGTASIRAGTPGLASPKSVTRRSEGSPYKLNTDPSPFIDAGGTIGDEPPPILSEAVKKHIKHSGFNARGMKPKEQDDVVVGCWASLGIMERFRIGETMLREWLQEMREGHDPAQPYSHYASSVNWTQMLYILLERCGTKPVYRSVDIFALLVIAIEYGVKHPGIPSPAYNPYAQQATGPGGVALPPDDKVGKASFALDLPSFYPRFTIFLPSFYPRFARRLPPFTLDLPSISRSRPPS